MVLAVWLALVVAGGVFGGQIFDRAATVSELSPSAESMRAAARLDQLSPEATVIIAITKDREPYDPELVASVQAVTIALEGIAKVESLYNAPGGMIGRDAKSTVVRAELIDLSKQDQVVAELRKIAAPRVLVSGEEIAEREFAETAVRDAAVGESVALVVLTLLLFLIFRRAAPVVVTLGTALASVAVTLLVLRGLAEVTVVSEFALNVVTLLGLGLTVDYALLILWRYREDQSWEKAGRAVLISGAAVSLALLGLLLFAEPLLAAMALGGLAASIIATAAALTLTPALIGIFGDRVLPAKNATPERLSLLGRSAAYAVRKPGQVALLSAGLLVLLALPFWGADLGNSDARALPEDSESRQAFEEMAQVFRHGRAEPVTVIVESDSGGEQMRDYLNKLNTLPGVNRLELRLQIPAGTTVIDLTPVTEKDGPAVVRAVRAVELDRPVIVGGQAAEVVDYRDAVLRKMPLVLAVLFVSLLGLLYLLTGSLVIPVKALLLNLLPLAASLGVLTILFGGHLDLTTPVLLFVFIFGLSMDYEVFLLSRITEEYRKTGDNERAIVTGLTRTGPVVTAAAACLIVVFLGFVFADLVPVREIGVGMAIALILDVTIVRGLLLPALMKLLGRWNWWPHRSPETV